MTPPKDREKRWLKEKGCKNVARMWREDLGMWVITPMVVGKEFKYQTPEWKPEKVYLKRHKRITFKMSEAQKRRFKDSPAKD